MYLKDNIFLFSRYRSVPDRPVRGMYGTGGRKNKEESTYRKDSEYKPLKFYVTSSVYLNGKKYRVQIGKLKRKVLIVYQLSRGPFSPDCFEDLQ